MPFAAPWALAAAPVADGPPWNITGDDWKHPDLRDRYAGWYSTYLANRLS